MKRSNIIQAAFSRGQLSSRTLGRSDLKATETALEVCFNAVITPRGEYERRPGTRFAGEAKTTGPLQLIPFDTTAEGPVMIEAGEGSFRFWQEGALLTGASGLPLEIATPYLAGQIEDIRFAQAGDSLYLTHPDHPPMALAAGAATASGFELAPVPLRDGPYLPVNEDPLCMVQHLPSGNRIAFLGCAPLTQADAGRAFRAWTGSQWVWDRIDTVISSVEASLTGEGTIAGQGYSFPHTDRWQIGAFYAGNYPAHVQFHDGRLAFASTRSHPHGLWLSEQDQHSLFGETAVNGDTGIRQAAFAALNDRAANAVTWLLSHDERLLIGTGSGLWQAKVQRSGSVPVVLSRLDATAAGPVPPVLAGTDVLFADRATSRLFARQGSRRAQDISLLADQLLKPGLSRLAFQAAPYGIVWAQRQDGRLLGLTYGPDEDVLAWHEHHPGPELAGADNPYANAAITALACLPEGEGDRLYLAVIRQIDGQARQFIEVLDPFWCGDLSETAYADCHVRTGSAPHLGAEPVCGLSDGQVILPAPGVTAGGSDPVLGLPYESRGAITDINRGSPDGHGRTRYRHLTEVHADLWRSAGFFAGPAAADQREFQYRLRDDPVAVPRPPADVPESTTVRVPRDAGGWARQVRFTWSQKWPLPQTVLSLALRLTASED